MAYDGCFGGTKAPTIRVVVETEVPEIVVPVVYFLL